MIASETRLIDIFELTDEQLRTLHLRGLDRVGDVLAKAHAIAAASTGRREVLGRERLAMVLWDASNFALPWERCLTLFDAIAPAIDTTTECGAP